MNAEAGSLALDYLRLGKMVFRVFAACALMLGLFITLSPAIFWGWLGIGIGADSRVVAILYGSVVMAVGLLSLLAQRHPRRYAPLLLFIGAYKGLAVIALGLHGSILRDMPASAWAIAGLYGLLSVACLWLYTGIERLQEKRA